MKGIILAGGLGTRLYPATHSISKQLLPIYDKPMIYYPLCTLLLAGISDILIITTPHEQPLFQRLLQDGSQFGIHLSYTIQTHPEGIAQAFLLSEAFIQHSSVCLVLGDNIVYGDGLSQKLQEAAKQTSGATIFGYAVSDPTRYGIIYFDKTNHPSHIIEKPTDSLSNYAVIGLYFYDYHVVDIAKQLKPSARGELEITDINNYYLGVNQLRVEKLGRGIAWLDMGTHQSMLEAANFIHVLEQRQGLKIGSPEEIAWRMGLISSEQLEKLATLQCKNSYGEYLLNLITS